PTRVTPRVRRSAHRRAGEPCGAERPHWRCVSYTPCASYGSRRARSTARGCAEITRTSTGRAPRRLALLEERPHTLCKLWTRAAVHVDLGRCVEPTAEVERAHVAQEALGGGE